MGQRSRKWFTKLGLDMWGFKKLRKYTVTRGAGFSLLPREITNIQERRLNRRLGGDRIGRGVKRGKRGKGGGGGGGERQTESESSPQLPNSADDTVIATTIPYLLVELGF